MPLLSFPLLDASVAACLLHVDQQAWKVIDTFSLDLLLLFDSAGASTRYGPSPLGSSSRISKAQLIGFADALWKRLEARLAFIGLHTRNCSAGPIL